MVGVHSIRRQVVKTGITCICGATGHHEKSKVLTLSFGLRLQLGLVFRDELADFVGHRQQCGRLLFVEGDREAAEAVDGDAALLAHLETRAAATLALEAFVFRFEWFEFRLQIVPGHGLTSPMVFRAAAAARTESRTRR